VKKQCLSRSSRYGVYTAIFGISKTGPNRSGLIAYQSDEIVCRLSQFAEREGGSFVFEVCGGGVSVIEGFVFGVAVDGFAEYISGKGGSDYFRGFRASTRVS
jgi:hypothetical protein